ncbi:uncharacterized protein [Asterias amurensis]|uniref:uncharacterized protein n=1 Tax=Asterias amurensis TaxID=7602 RepID=UPI003AB642DA
MADSIQKRMEELSGIYNDICTSSGTFGNFLRSKLTKDVLKKCNITAVDLRYSTLLKDKKLYSFSDHWDHETAVHVYSTRLDDPVMLPMRDKNKLGADDTSCARMFVTSKPIRILSVQQSPFLELCKKWAAGHHELVNSTSNGAPNGDEDTPSSDLTPPPRDVFTRKNGLSLLDYTLFQERISGFHSIEGVAYEEAPSTQQTPYKQIALFSGESLLLQQEFVYPAKKKLHKSDNGFMCCNVEPSRPQAPPMKRGKSVNTPPFASQSPGGKPLSTPPLPPPPHTPGSAPPTPPPPYSQTKTTPQPTPTPRPRTPTMPEEKGDGKGAPKPPMPATRSTPKDTTAGSNDDFPKEDVPKEDETDTKM